MSDLPSQYAEEVETFKHILDLPEPRETIPRSSTSVLVLDDEKGQQELRPRGPSAMLPLNLYLKDAFEKFEQDFLGSNLPEGKYIKTPASTAKYYSLVLRTNYRSLIQILPRSVFLLNPLGLLMGKVPLHVLKELVISTKLGRFSLPLTLQLPLQRLLPLVTLLWRSVSTVLRLPLKGLKARFRRVPILKKLPGVTMNTPVTILGY